MASAIRNRSNRSTSADNGRKLIESAAQATITPAPPVDAPPAPVVPLSNRTGALIFAELQSFASSAVCIAAASLVCAVGGDVTRAVALVGDGAPITAHIHRAAAIRSVLTKTAPRDCFTDDYANPHGARIGDLYANALGLSPLYRADNKAQLKNAREKARALVAKAK